MPDSSQFAEIITRITGLAVMSFHLKQARPPAPVPVVVTLHFAGRYRLYFHLDRSA